MKYEGEFPSQVGVEQTFIPKWRTPLVTDEYDKMMQRGKKLDDIASTLKEERPCYYVHRDSYCIEFSSPVFSYEEDLERFANDVFKLANKHKIVPSHVFNFKGVEYHGAGGGGHIHVRIPRTLTDTQLVSFNTNSVLDILHRPYINWMFQEWINNSTKSTALITYCEHRNGSINEWFQPFINARYGPVCPRSNIMRGKMPTVEYRLFKAHENKRDLLLAIDFCLAHHEYILSITKTGVTLPINLNAMKFVSKNEKTVTNLAREYFQTLGLNFSDYEHFLQNYRLRKEHGSL